MSHFIFLLISGVAWLGVVALAPTLGLEPQWVSLLRGAYLGMFSIALIVELRQVSRPRTTSDTQTWFYLIPILSVMFYNLFSSVGNVGWHLAAVIFCFFVAQMTALRIRQRFGQMRQGWWELAPPVLLLGAILVGPFLWPAFVVLLVLMLGADLVGHKQVNRSSLDAVIMQLPSFCLAPVVLVLARDALSMSQGVDRASLEVAGLIINGTGGALWTVLVMREQARLARLSLALWLGGAVGALVALTFQRLGVWPLVQTLGLLGVLELLRGAVWLLTTHFLSYMARWRGACVNLAATLLPLGGALAMRADRVDGAGVLVYTLFLAPLFVVLLSSARQRRAGAGT